MKLVDEQFGFIKGLVQILQFLMVLVLIGLGISIVSILLDFLGSDFASGTILSSASAIMSESLILITVYYLLNILATIETGNPFVAENVKRLQLLGGILIGIDLLFSMSIGIMKFTDVGIAKILSELKEESLLDGLGGLFTGAILIVISEVFRIGIKLREENELTI